ncbi:MAG: HAMP domain-containing histidine kinase [Ardenticatenales bacterium]|nr:HAMP domain-containing histidine kinase [Ardenticatenales bacterium]
MIRRIASLFIYESELNLARTEVTVRNLIIGTGLASFLCLILPASLLGVDDVEVLFRIRAIAVAMTLLSLLLAVALHYLRPYLWLISTLLLIGIAIAALFSTPVYAWDQPYALLPLVIPVVIAPLISPPATALLVSVTIVTLLAIAGTRYPDLNLPGTILINYLFIAFLVTLVGRAIRQYVLQIEHATRQLRDANEALAQKGEQLQQAMEQLVAASQAREALLSTIGHDLRSPVAVIIGHIDLLRFLFADKIDAEISEVLTIVSTNSRHLMALMDDMVNLSKIQAGKLQMNLEPIDGQRMLEQLSRTHQQAAEAKGLSLTLDSSKNLSPLYADPLRFTQVMTNLLSNAIKYTNEGEIAVTLRPAEGEWVLIRVADTGEGIPAESLPTIFEPFSQTERSRRRQDSTGLGLSIVKYLSEAQGGQISVESTVDEGTTFTLRWPTAPPPRVGRP